MLRTLRFGAGSREFEVVRALQCSGNATAGGQYEPEADEEKMSARALALPFLPVGADLNVEGPRRPVLMRNMVNFVSDG